MNPPREPKPLAGTVYHPGAGFHSYPPPKDRTPRPRVCGHCELVSATNLPRCPVCGARFEPPPVKRFLRRFRRA
ncbi:MAG TPA: hypothetical protein VH247_07870 [Thermoleophilaceae bacterium]|jgi:hypothetical protein|nr:hypothetical protein [Thermoleophilaceae bacterium]